MQKESGKLDTRIDDLEGAHMAICDILEIEDKQMEQNSRYDTINHTNRETLQLLNENIVALQLKDDRTSIFSEKSKRSRTSRRSKQLSV